MEPRSTFPSVAATVWLNATFPPSACFCGTQTFFLAYIWKQFNELGAEETFACGVILKVKPVQTFCFSELRLNLWTLISTPPLVSERRWAACKAPLGDFCDEPTLFQKQMVLMKINSCRSVAAAQEEHQVLMSVGLLYNWGTQSISS